MSKPKVTIADQDFLSQSGERILLTDLARILGRPYGSIRYAAWAQQTGREGPLVFPLHQRNGRGSRLFVLKKDVIRINAELNSQIAIPTRARTRT